MIKTLRNFGRPLALAIAFLAFGFFARWAEAALILIGTPAGKPGDIIELSLAVTAGTAFDNIDIVPDYEALSPVLLFQELRETDALKEGGLGGCFDGSCGYFYLSRKSFDEDTVLATLQFQVSYDAEEHIDMTSRKFPFDLDVLIRGQKVPILEPDKAFFTVLAVPEVPEPSSALLLAGGMMLLAGVYGRRYERCPRAPAGSPLSAIVPAQ
jgi:hypothetical protein